MSTGILDITFSVEIEYFKIGENEWEASTPELGTVYSYCREGCRRELIKIAKERMKIKPSNTRHSYNSDVYRF
jgi:hypothetical protein